MPLACCFGQGPAELANLLGFAPKVDAANVALVGIRDVDELERGQLHNAGVCAAFTMRDIDERGMRDIMRDALAIVSNGTAGFTSLSISISSIRNSRPASELRFAAAPPIARLTSPWKWVAIPPKCSPWKWWK